MSEPQPSKIKEEVERCPKCGSTDTERGHHAGSAHLPETDYKRCGDCGHQWDHQ